MRFTTTWVDKLKPTTARKDYTATNLPGFMLRVEPTGNKSFVFRYQLSGKRRVLTLGTYPQTTLDVAQKRYDNALTILDSGRDPSAVIAAQKESEGAAGTVDVLVTEWYERYALKWRKRPEAAKGLLDNNLKPWFRSLKAKDVTRRQVITLLDEITDRSAAVSNDVAALLKQIFAFGVERDFIAASPIVALKPPGGKERPRERALTDAEVSVVWRKLPDCDMSERVQLALKFLLLTAQRRGETAMARWDQIDFDSNVWSIPSPNAKNDNAHAVPLSAFALSILQRLKVLAGASELVFPTAHSAKKAGASMTERAITRSVRKNENIFGIPHFTPHDFRRTARTGMARLDVSDALAERVLNHKPQGMIAVYNKHDYLAEKRQALDAWAAHVEKVVSL